MHHVSIPGVTQPLSRLALGTLLFGNVPEEQAFDVLDAFIALGGNTVDTANSYARGQAEAALGRWLRERGNRERLVIIDKGCHPTATSPVRVTPEDIQADLAQSLERLQTGYIDLYLLHRDDESVPVGTLVEALNAERERGRIHAFGGSNWRPARLAEANAYAAEHGLTGFVASSPNFSLARPMEPMWAGCISIDEAAYAWHVATQMPVVAWSAGAGGFFSGRFSPEDTRNADMVRVYYNAANWVRFERAQEVAARHGSSPQEVALAWVLNQPFPVVALIGPRTVAELHSSLGADNLELSPEELANLDAMDEVTA